MESNNGNLIRSAYKQQNVLRRNSTLQCVRQWYCSQRVLLQSMPNRWLEEIQNDNGRVWEKKRLEWNFPSPANLRLHSKFSPEGCIEVFYLSMKRWPSYIHVALIQDLAQAMFQKRYAPFSFANAINPSRSFKIPKIGLYDSARLLFLLFWCAFSQGFSDCYKKVQLNFAP